LLSKAKNEAERASLPLTVFTFKDNRDIKKNATRIYDEGAKLELMRRLGVDTVILADFPTLSGISAEEFVKNVLVGTLGARVAVAGYNFRFGKGASADAAYLKNAFSALGRECEIIEEYSLDGRALSSSYIRELLSHADMKGAARALGMPYFIEGEVSRGDGRGASLGIPTANLPLSPEAELLKRGVYCQLTGPSFETPAEIRLLRTLGADMVGMSTVIEAITARHAGMRVCGVSLVTNYAAGIRAEQLNHEEVKAAGVKAQPMFARLVSASIEAMKDI
jgi:riboflavin kinase/FMN adenylyltransferase